jgi:hypothetical protein
MMTLKHEIFHLMVGSEPNQRSWHFYSYYIPLNNLYRVMEGVPLNSNPAEKENQTCDFILYLT